MICCSFLPAATQMIYDMNLQHLLGGVTFECPGIALKEKQKVVRYLLEGNTYTSIEIDRIFSASKAGGKSLYYVDDTLLAELSPDLIFTQDVCEVCQIDTACTAAAVAKLTRQPKLVPLSPNTLRDVFGTAVTIASALGREEAAYVYLSASQNRIDRVIDKIREHRLPPRRVMIMEWIEPIYNCGHWIPDQVAFAGGVDMLSNPGGDSMVTPWEKVLRYNPEVLVIAPCGFDVQRTVQEADILVNKEGWKQLAAVQNHEVYITDFDLFTQPSAGTLTDGIEMLAALFNPAVFTLPTHLQNKCVSLNSVLANVL